MKYFTPDFLKFFEELESNNHKDWFDANKKRYEKEVKKPFETLVFDLIQLMKTDIPNLMVEPKNCIFRINRDIRFSKDKTSYKTLSSALITEGGRKGKASPGMYVELSAKHVRVYSGVYEADKTQLEDIRYYIANNLESFKKAYSDKEFVKHFGEIRGERNKILPPDLKEIALKEPMIFNKQFYYFSQLPAQQILTDQLAVKLYEIYTKAKPVNEFLTKALGL